MHIERAFAHILDAGGQRRTTLRGWENLNKRFKLAAAFYNLSQLMRKLFGFGTPKQLAAALKGAGGGLFSLCAFLLTLMEHLIDNVPNADPLNPLRRREVFHRAQNLVPPEKAVSSTGC